MLQRSEACGIVVRQNMHKTELHPEVSAERSKRPVRLRVFESLDFRPTAHFMVDLQNGFMAPRAVAEIPAAPRVHSRRQFSMA
jgi:ureidoacrylate peracid hydrolase